MVAEQPNRVPDLVKQMGALLFPLPPGSKAPYTGTGRHAHKEAVTYDNLLLRPTENYGISLDKQFLVVDFDREDTTAWKSKMAPTLRTKTRRGEHWVYSTPEGYIGQNKKFPAGDVKCNGYIVGPGSVVEGNVYLIIDPRLPEPAPQWLLDYCSNKHTEEVPASGGEEHEVIPDGGRDNALASIAGSLRKHGLSERAIKRNLWLLVENGVVEQPEGREVTYGDVKRIARSIASKSTDPGLGLISTGGITYGNEVDLVLPPVRWWVRGFVPRGELVMIYGPGGIGKSSFASWLAVEVTKKKGRLLFVGVEEPFSRFLWRAYLAGVNRSLVCALDRATGFQLPRDIPKLKEIIENSGIDVVYLDSIYSHFESIQGQNSAERARRCLGPLAALAQETGATILATFHENKGGDFLGSVEMVNVARCVLRASRKGKGPLVVSAKKTNLLDPGFAMTFVGVKKPMVDAETGEVQLEEDDEGNMGVMDIVIAERGENRVSEDEALDTVDVDEVVRPGGSKGLVL